MSNDWSKFKLGDLIKFTGGSQPPRRDFIYEEKEGYVRLIQTRDYRTDKYKTYIKESSSKRYCTADDVMIGRYGPPVFQIFRGLEGSYNVALIKAEPKRKNLTKDYIYYFLSRNDLFLAIDRLSRRTSGQTGVDMDFLKNFEFPLPQIPEQKAIVELLSTWDEAIEKTERLIQVKERHLKGQIQKLISQRCDSWPHTKPKKIFDTITEKNFPDEELLSVTQDRGVIPRSMLEGRVMSPDGTTASYKLIKRGDFAISLRSFQGGIEYSIYQGIISPAYTVLRPKIELSSDFYRLFFKSYIFIEKYLNLAVIGIRDGKQISIPDFLSIKIPVPPLEQQKEIAETLSVCQHEIDLLKQLAEKYKTQKRGLMQNILSGECRILPEIVFHYIVA